MIPGLPPRYTPLAPLATGGMGEVWRVRDEVLRGQVVLKLCLADVSARPRLRQRFVDEARLTAQLDHPGIPSVHDLGELPDGRPWFTMEEVRGRTLAEVIRERAAGGPEAWPLRRLVDLFHRATQAVAYAHAHGVLHRDLKPENLMVGAFGEVRVMDWGLARRLEEEDTYGEIDLGPRAAGSTVAGEVVGTPAFMAPEQAAGRVDRVGKPADIYALGAVLHTILTGRPPFEGTGRDVLLRLLQGPPPPLDPRGLPGPLCEVVGRAMARDPYDRHADAAELAGEVAAWLDGDAARARALAILERADAAYPRVATLRAAAREQAAEARARLAAVPTWAPEAEKRPAWALATEAEAARAEADQLEVAYEHELGVALDTCRGLPEGLDRLADLRRDQLLAAEAAGDERAAALATARLRSTRRHDAWLDEPATLSLATDPPGAPVTLQPWVLDGLRLVPGEPRPLGRSPLDRVPVPPGRYRLVVEGPGGSVVLPLRLGRGEAWRPVRPGTGAWTLRLPRPGELGPDDVFVPGGWARLGGGDGPVDPEPPRVLWIDDFVIRRHPVTLAELASFLDALVLAGREGEAGRLEPREVLSGGERAPVLLRRDGRYTAENRRGQAPDSPAVLVNLETARAYAAWEAGRSGLPWRLPTGLEREKAARGTDGRTYPWGDQLDPALLNITGSSEGHPALAPVGAFPTDESPYGVRGLAGNVRDLCGDAYARLGSPARDGLPTPLEPEGEAFVVVRGGAWVSSPAQCHAASRFATRPGDRYVTMGFRLARSTPASTSPSRPAAGHRGSPGREG